VAKESDLILGLDPGLQITGYAVLKTLRSSDRMLSPAFDSKPKLVEAGVLRVSRSLSLDKRLAELHKGLVEILDSYHFDCVAIEQLYSHYERPRTAILMGHARGVLCLAAAQHNIKVCSYAATKVKKMLTGNGRAPKSQMQQAVATQLGLPAPPEPADVADAIAVALCHFYQSKTLFGK
jgi:crossover junction endodeoxyribonuclease RuvC